MMRASFLLSTLSVLLALPLSAQVGPRPASASAGGATAGEVATPATAGAVGVMVMAHGGDEAWNASVSQAVDVLGQQFPVALAFGMATPRTMEAALDSLRAVGVEQVAVVRMFLSGHSFREQTDYLLGLSATPPERFVIMDHGAPASGGGHGSTGVGEHGEAGGHGDSHGPVGHDPAEPLPIAHGLTVATHDEGLLGSREAMEIAVDRALELSTDPAGESVLYLAHGMGDDTRNQEVLDALAEIAGHPGLANFAALEVATLREDWPEKRAVAEEEIRTFVRTESEKGRRVLVIPARLSGFGPYAKVLDGLEFVPGRGLLPHSAVARWMEARALDVVCAEGWGVAAEVCPAT